MALPATRLLDLQQLCTLFHHIDDMVFIIHAEDFDTFKVVYVNPAYMKATGATLEQLKDKPLEDLIQADEIQAMKAHYQNAISKGQAFTYEEAVTMMENKKLYETTLLPLSYEDTASGHYLVGISHDISHKQQQEQAIQLAHKELRDIIQNQQGLLFKVERSNHDFYYTLCDGQLMYELGYTPVDVINKRIQDLFKPPQAAALNQHYTKCWENQEQVVFETHLSNEVSWLTSLNPIIENGKTIALVGSSIDIREKKQTEEALIQSEKLALLGELAAGIGHEIRNPLTVIKGFISLMLQDPSFLTPRFIKLIESEIDYIDQTAGELMMLAKPQVQKSESLDIHSLLKEIVMLLDAEAFKHRVTIQTNYTDDSTLIYGDKHQLKKALFNLVKNAIEAMHDKKGGTVYISCYKEESSIIVQIQDEGNGIPPDRIHQLGKPFYTTKEKGNGLGLMVTYRVIRQHGGQILCESELGEGTTFTIAFSLTN